MPHQCLQPFDSYRGLKAVLKKGENAGSQDFSFYNVFKGPLPQKLFQTGLFGNIS